MLGDPMTSIDPRARRPRRAPGTWWALAAAQIAVLVTGLASLPGLRHDEPPSLPPVVAVTRPAAVSTASSDPLATAKEVAGDVALLLAARDDALRQRDRAGYVGATQPGTAARRASSALFANIADVPLSDWTETVDEATVKATGKDTYAMLVVRRYRIAGFDPGGVAQRRELTVARTSDRWFVVSDEVGDGVRRELWESGPVVVARGEMSLVMAHPAAKRRLAQYVTIADAAVRTVSKVWGSDWSRRVVVIVPSTAAELGRVLDSSADYAQIAALATADVVDAGGSRTALAERVVVNPDTFGRLSALGQRIVMAHEVTHVATRRITGKSMPSWLVEGFADYVAYRDSGVDTRVAARDLTPAVRLSPLPSSLPDDDEFDPGSANLAASYELSWLACRFIAQQTSEAKLIAFYKAVGADSGKPDVVVRRHFDDVLDTTPESFTAAWRRHVEQAVS